MKTRVITSIVLIAVLAAVLFLFNTPFFELALCIIALIAVREIFNAFQLGKNETHIYLAFVPLVFLVMYSHLPVIENLLVPVCFAFMLFMAVCLIMHSQTLSAAKLGGMISFSALAIISFYSFAFIKARLPVAQFGYEAVFVIIMILAFAWGGDTAAYFVGSACGKHKLAPVVSPKKTVEGAIGGLIGSGLLGLLCTFGARLLLPVVEMGESAVPYLPGNTFSYLSVFVLGMVCSVLGILGDLFASVVKRQCEIKDYGRIFPGHGGILDRFDSVLFIAPLVAIAVWWVTGGAI